MKYPAIYIRVSTDAQAEEGYSIDAQKEQLAAYCVSKGMKNYKFYIDGGWSGSNINRPEVQSLIEDVYAEKVSHVIVYKLDRLSRSQKDTLYLIEEVFIPHDVAFISLTETLDTSTPMGRAMIGILAAFAQLERENIRMRTRMGMLERVKSGLWMGGGRVPFGYNYDRNQGILVPNKDADTVREVYKMYLDGYGQQEIADTLGLKYERLVTQIITRKTNYGVIEYNGVEYQGKHQPLITKETYDKAVAEMRRRSVNRVTYTDHLFTGLIYCGHCGAKMRYQKWNKSTGRCKLICYSQQKSKAYLIKDPNCSQPKIWADEVEKLVLEYIFNIETEELKDKSETLTNKSKEDVLLEQKDKLTRKIKNLYVVFAESENELLLETINDLKQELSEIEKKIKIEQDRVNNVVVMNEYNDVVHGLRDKWNYIDIKEQQKIIRMLVNKIVITDDNIDIDLNI